MHAWEFLPVYILAFTVQTSDDRLYSNAFGRYDPELGAKPPQTNSEFDFINTQFPLKIAQL